MGWRGGVKGGGLGVGGRVVVMGFGGGGVGVRVVVGGVGGSVRGG